MIRGLMMLTIVAVLAGCSRDLSMLPPQTMDDVAGIYHFQSFTTDSAGASRDWIAAGASIDLLLLPGGQVSGEFVIPPIPPDTLIGMAMMDGTWSLTGDTVRISQTVDTFIRDMVWIAGPNQLAADQTFSGVRVRVVLTK